MHSNSVATLSVNKLTCVTFFRQEAYKFDVYATKSYPQPCLKYACCNGYTSLKGVCYGKQFKNWYLTEVQANNIVQNSFSILWPQIIFIGFKKDSQLC